MSEIKKPETHIDSPEQKIKPQIDPVEHEQLFKKHGENLDSVRFNPETEKPVDASNKSNEPRKLREISPEGKDLSSVRFPRSEAETSEQKDSERGKSEIKEISSPFARENFKEENSFDAKSKLEHPKLNELKSKCVYEVQPMGTRNEQIDRSAKGEYTEEERKYIKDIRDNIDAPTAVTKMQKVIGVDTGNMNEDLKHYLNPTDSNGKTCKAQVFGFVAKAEDAAPFTGTPQKCFDNLRLDYDPGPGKENPYKNPGQAVYVIRFTDGTNYEIPYSEEFGGKRNDGQPFTGNGFVSAKDVAIPEYVVQESKGMGAVVTDGEIFRIYPDGNEKRVAYYNDETHKFEPEKGEKI